MTKIEAILLSINTNQTLEQIREQLGFTIEGFRSLMILAVKKKMFIYDNQKSTFVKNPNY